MLRTAAMARAAALSSRRQLLWSSSSSFPNHQAILNPIAFIDHHCPNPRFPFFNSPSRSYARMARRIPPPLRRTPHESEESESESESEPEEELNELDFDEYGGGGGGDDDDGGESEEWEGFTMDFGSISKRDDNPDKTEEEKKVDS